MVESSTRLATICFLLLVLLTTVRPSDQYLLESLLDRKIETDNQYLIDDSASSRSLKTGNISKLNGKILLVFKPFSLICFQIREAMGRKWSRPTCIKI
jgi:hypothetical protein